MPILRNRTMQRWLTTLFAIGLTFSGLQGCSTYPAAPRTIELAAIVVDGARLARSGEGGLVSVWRNGGQLQVQPGMALQRGDRVETFRDATAVIRWPNGNEIYLRPGSSGEIGSVTRFFGELFAKVRGAFAVETEFVRAGALGTQFHVRSGAGGATAVTVFDGRVEVSSPRGAWPAEVLQAGSTGLAHPRRPVPARASPDELARTREWVERIEKLVPPARSAGSGSNVGEMIAAAAVLLAAGVVVASNRDRGNDSSATANPDPAARDKAATAAKASPPPALTAPRGMVPGGPSESAASALFCRDSVLLDWNPVDGALDYAVALESKAVNGAWRGTSSSVVAESQYPTQAGLDGLFRWRVQARNAGGSGPFSAWLYFRCSTTYLR